MAWAKLCIVMMIVSMFFMIQYGEAQIPSQCVESLSPGGTNERRCCPNAVVNDVDLGECGGPNRGKCTELNIDQQMNDNYDPREKWPIKYFTHVCNCTDDYGGVDCGSCAYGRYPHPTCEKMLVAKRRNLKSYSSGEWEKYLNTIKMTRNYDSGYKVIVNGDSFLQGLSSIEVEKRDITLYKFFVWIHYFAAKDSESNIRKLDFAHEGTGFLTWHRQLLLWLEWKIQEMLRVNEDKEYHKFRLPFWEWIDEKERNKYFSEDRLGESLYERKNNPHITTKLQGTLFGSDGGSEWQTICWRREGPDGSNCDPNNETGLLLRCPKRPAGYKHSDPCNDKAYWPTIQDVWDAVDELSIYDAKDSSGIYSACPTKDNFRSNLEGFKLSANGMCDVDDLMCSDPKPDSPTPDCSRSRRLHNSVHTILGAADIKGLDPNHELYINPNEQGVMSNVAASPNDPIFINHHAMVDCIFEEWFKKDNYGPYPEGANKDGHGIDDYIVPFIPLFTHRDMFKSSKSFGYECGAVGLAPVFFVTLLTSVCTLVISLML